MLAAQNVIQLIIKNYFHRLAHQSIPILIHPPEIVPPVNAKRLLEVVHLDCAV
jgi:hypothetical protein